MAMAAPIPPNAGPNRLQRQGALSDALSRLKLRMQRSQDCDRDLYTILLGVSRNIDVLVNSRDRYDKPQEMYSVIIQVARCFSKERRAWPVLVVLLLSAKGACSAGWFAPAETEELLSNLNTLLASCTRTTSAGEPSVELAAFKSPYDPLTNLSLILHRFFPRLQFVEKILGLDMEVGYQMVACDFHVARRLKGAETVRLFVARKNDISTSACLVTAPGASFMVNGKAIPGRTIINADKGPQMPTDVTGTVRLGPNLLQIVGEFSVPFTVIIGFFNSKKWDAACVKLPECSTVKEVKARDALDDDEIEEGPSRVSLVCPISHLRMKTPVKGASCHHHQCFDYDSFIAINDRRPAWRCPCCNTNLTLQDIQLDGNLAKVLEEVKNQAGVCDILIFPDGSWQPVRNKRGHSSSSFDSQELSKKQRLDPGSRTDVKSNGSREAGRGAGEGGEPDIVDLSSDEDDVPFNDSKPSREDLANALGSNVTRDAVGTGNSREVSANGLNHMLGAVQDQPRANSSSAYSASFTAARNPAGPLETAQILTQHRGVASLESQAQGLLRMGVTSPSDRGSSAEQPQPRQYECQQHQQHATAVTRGGATAPGTAAACVNPVNGTAGGRLMNAVEQRAHRNWQKAQQEKLAAQLREIAASPFAPSAQSHLMHPNYASGSQQTSQLPGSAQPVFRSSASASVGLQHRQQQYVNSAATGSFPSHPPLPGNQHVMASPSPIASTVPRGSVSWQHSLRPSGLRDQMHSPMSAMPLNSQVNSGQGAMMAQGRPLTSHTPIMAYQDLSERGPQHTPGMRMDVDLSGVPNPQTMSTNMAASPRPMLQSPPAYAHGDIPVIGGGGATARWYMLGRESQPQ